MVSHHPTDSLTAGWLGGLGPAKESRSGARQAKVQVEGIAYSFCGLWISSVLACLCVTSQLNSTAPGSIPGVGYANNPKRLLMAMVPRRPTTSTSPTRPRRPMMPGSQQRQGGQPGALGPGLPALRILPWFDLRCWLRLRPTMPRGY